MSYNQDNGALCIDETGATIQTVGTEHFRVIFSADNFNEIMRIAALINSMNRNPFENKIVPSEYLKTLLNTDYTGLSLSGVIINLSDL